MRALTLHQPWATLVAIGAKRIETRSWHTAYRGLVAIHAGRHRPPMQHLPKLWSRGKDRAEQEHHNHRTWLVIDTITDDRYKGPRPTGSRVPKRAQTPTLFWPAEGPFGAGVYDPRTGEGGHREHLPLGAVVAVANLVDCVPMVDRWPATKSGRTAPIVYAGPDYPKTLWRTESHEGEHLGDEAHLGDYRPGRWAWLLDDVHRLAEPIECRGRQGLWTVPGDVKVRILMAQLEDSLAAAGAAKSEGHR